MKQHTFKFLKVICSPVTLILIVAILITGCKKNLEIPAPSTSLNSKNVYASDATAASVLTGIYASLSNAENNIFYGFGSGFATMPVFSSLSADELTLYNISDQRYFPYYNNQLTADNGDIWKNAYSLIFVANAAIEGLNSSTSLTPAVRQQLLGEAKFMRAFFYFYLVNLYGDVPLATSTDYQINGLLPRAPKDSVYQQITTDLLEAQSLLTDNYVDADALTTTGERVRPNKWAATALLARTYLYRGDFTNAQIQSTAVIDQRPLYLLKESLNEVFLANSDEAIWQLQPVVPFAATNTGQGAFYILPDGPNESDHPVYLSDLIINKFEPADQRKVDWTGSVETGGITYYFPYKYKIGAEDAPVSEYIMVLRLAEQYLIRAETRAQLGDIEGAAADLDTIRSRAGLSGTTATTQAEMLTAIQDERQVELFTEWGDRWFELKRTGTIDEIMPHVMLSKGGTWNTNWQWYPIPVEDLQRNPNLKQNSGYQ